MTRWLARLSALHTPAATGQALPVGVCTVSDNPYRDFCTFALATADEATKQFDCQEGKPLSQHVWEESFRDKEAELRELRNAGLTAADRTGFPIPEVERRLAELANAVIGLLLWQRDAPRLSAEDYKREKEMYKTVYWQPVTGPYFLEQKRKVLGAWDAVDVLAVRLEGKAAEQTQIGHARNTVCSCIYWLEKLDQFATADPAEWDTEEARITYVLELINGLGLAIRAATSAIGAVKLHAGKPGEICSIGSVTAPSAHEAALRLAEEYGRRVFGCLHRTARATDGNKHSEMYYNGASAEELWRAESEDEIRRIFNPGAAIDYKALVTKIDREALDMLRGHGLPADGPQALPILEQVIELMKAKWAGPIPVGQPAGEAITGQAAMDPKAHAQAADQPRRSPKRSTERGEARAKLIAALTEHHQYANGSCLNQEPIGNNELARVAKVAKRTASAFFQKEFKGHAKYKAICADANRLISALKMLNGEFSPHILYGDKPPEQAPAFDDE
jgi:hypothetical protein